MKDGKSRLKKGGMKQKRESEQTGEAEVGLVWEPQSLQELTSPLDDAEFCQTLGIELQ